ncbi:deoxyribose-phosphate aldolase [Bizionia algoritergicola]|uniref:Deoxyribose-phosphate aldolase n=1 Tax=Bizionia algoritergicola TaxID=291187 RepID=A0A5D0QTB9_9FLAO|nr:deoxyribose-phosphate aldolase [Bizionia algoritergicola]
MTANEIVKKAIKVAGGNKLDRSSYSFQFRDIQYHAARYNGYYSLIREFHKDSVGFVQDYIDNNGFERYIDEKQVMLADTTAAKLSASVNSVHYFAILPHGLNDAAVNKQLIGKVTIKDVPYYKIKVTFNEEGGGEDFEDEFIYWIQTKTFKVDYLAYSYQEEDGVGFRFREAFNERYVAGLRFVDYNNYKSEAEGVSVEDLDDLFEKQQLKLLSKIKLENIIEGPHSEVNP